MNINAFRQLSYGLYVISTWDQGRATGCTANSAMQITAEPATIAISINHDNYTNQCIEESGKFAVSILGENSDPGIIGIFGFQSGKENNKFEQTAQELRCNMPIVADACAYLVCDVVDKMETSTHTVFLGKVIDADILKEDDAMTYAYYHKVIKGKSPKNAPTYIPEADGTDTGKNVSGNDEKYVCGVCGYVYDGTESFEDLPDDYVCPVCKQPKSVFKKNKNQ